MALFGIGAVVLLYQLVKEISGEKAAIAVSILWAVSPAIVTADRIIWEPNLVPFFSLLFIFLLYRAHHDSKPLVYTAFLGAVSGILVQLHYPDMIFPGLFVLYCAGLYVTKQSSLRSSAIRFLVWLGGFGVTLAPFIVYELRHGFADIAGIVSVMGEGGSFGVGKRVMLHLGLDYASRVTGRMVPLLTPFITGALLVSWGWHLMRRFRLYHVFLFVWFAVGLIAMVRFRGVVHDHYLYFLLPVPFLVLGSVLSEVRGKFAWSAVAVFIVFVAVYQITKTDVLLPGTGDIPRVTQAVSAVSARIGSAPFSFTLINSRSFSDLHYRYEMAAAGLSPHPVTDRSYSMLALICDSSNCPPVADIIRRQVLQVVCYDEHCSGEYPQVQLTADWKYLDTATIAGENGKAAGAVYFFRRKP